MAHLWENFRFFWLEPSGVWPYSVYNGLARFPKGYREAPGYADYSRLHALLTTMGLLSLLLLYRKRRRDALLLTVFALYYSLFYILSSMFLAIALPYLRLYWLGRGFFPRSRVRRSRRSSFNFRIHSNVLLAAIMVVLLTGMSMHQFLQRSNYIRKALLRRIGRRRNGPLRK